MGRVSGGSGIRLACLLLASLAAPTDATLTKINNVNPSSLPGVLGMGSLGVEQGNSFTAPKSVLSNTGFTQVTLKAETGPPTFFVYQQNQNSWEGGLPDFMYNVYNQGVSLLRLEFDPPILAFATYVDVSDQCFMSAIIMPRTARAPSDAGLACSPSPTISCSRRTSRPTMARTTRSGKSYTPVPRPPLATIPSRPWVSGHLRQSKASSLR